MTTVCSSNSIKLSILTNKKHNGSGVVGSRTSQGAGTVKYNGSLDPRFEHQDLEKVTSNQQEWEQVLERNEMYKTRQIFQTQGQRHR